MISKSKINKGKRKKTNPEIVETINLAKKNNLLLVGKRIASPTRRYASVNVGELNGLDSNKVMIIGKILSAGEVKKKIEVSALGFSKKAKEKLAKAGCKIMTIKEEIEKNPKLDGVKVI